MEEKKKKIRDGSNVLLEKTGGEESYSNQTTKSHPINPGFDF